MKNDFLSIIREERNKKGLLQSEVATALGLNRATYIAKESGKSPLNITELKKLCIILGIRISDLFSAKKEKYDSEKFKQLYYYILKNYYGGSQIKKTKLAKLFYLIDFTSYYIYDKSITGASYYKNHYGPLAAHFLSVTDMLFEKGLIRIRVDDIAQLISISESNKEYNPNIFTEKEKEIINGVCLYWNDKSTSEIVNFTHTQKPWSESVDKEYIPYETIKSEKIDNIYAPTSEMILKIQNGMKI